MTNENKTNGPGRPPELADGKRVNVYLDQRSLEAATRLGNGNFSLGIRQALDEIEPLTVAAQIERIRSRHIGQGAGLFVNDLDEMIQGLLKGEQGDVLKHLKLDDPDLIRELRQRDNFEIAGKGAGFDIIEICGNGFVATNMREVEQYLATIRGKLSYDEGICNIVGSGYETHRGAEFEDAVSEWLGNSEDFLQVQDTREDAWQDACNRNSIPPFVLKPAGYFQVSKLLADELVKRGEIVSPELMGGCRVWGCIDQINFISDFADVPVLKEILNSREARNKLLETPKKF